MDDQRVGTAVRMLRQRLAWRQVDLATKTSVSISTISRIERGHIGTLSFDTFRRVAAALDLRVEHLARWRAGDLDRLLNARHSRFYEIVARILPRRFPGWSLTPEVSFSVFGERGVIDIVCWHAASRALLVIELKTDIADVNELIGTFDRKVRLAWRIADERGWDPLVVSGWVIVSPGRTNRARIAAHGAVLRAAFPTDGRGIAAWLRRPLGKVSALSIWPNWGDSPQGSSSPNGSRRAPDWPNSHRRTITADLATVRRVRPRRIRAG